MYIFEDMIKDLKIRLPGWALNAIISAFIKERWREIKGTREDSRATEADQRRLSDAAKDC